MPDLSDDLFLGRTADEMGDLTQDEVNEDLLYFHDQQTLINGVTHPLSKYSIKTLFETIGENNDFFLVLLREISKTYHLENLKLFLSPAFTVSDPENISNDIYTPYSVKLLYYNLKVSIPDFIREKKFSIDTERNAFEDFLKTQKTSKLLLWAISYLDKFSWNMFKKEIFRQYDLPFPD